MRQAYVLPMSEKRSKMAYNTAHTLCVNLVHEEDNYVKGYWNTIGNNEGHIGVNAIAYHRRMHQRLYPVSQKKKYNGKGEFSQYIRRRYRIQKYTDLISRIRECIICNEWDFLQAADYLMLTRKECQHCLNIIETKAESIEGAVAHYFSNSS